ncbi:MAG TPA: hypothetical protein VKU77_03410 [Streptosporangiaceae bacterium]|nr:hypothetical protein [Streptosporangiaceae bacterium]
MNRDRAEVYLRLLAEEELRLAVARCPDGPAGSWPVDDAVRPVSVAGALAGRAARRGGGMAPGRGWSADRAVAGLYLAHYQALMRQAGMMVRDTRVAEEVVQGSFVAMHGGWPRLGDARAAEDYLSQEVANRSRAVLRHGAGRGGSPQQLRPGGSGEHLARAARVAQLMTAVNGRVGQYVSSHRRVARAARALTTVGALDDGVAGQILGDLELALAARRAVSPGWIGPVQSWWWRPWPVRPEPAGPAAGPVRVVRLGQVIPVRDQDTDGEVYLLSYAHTAAGPQLSVLAPARLRPAPPGQPAPPRPAIPPENGPGRPLIDGWIPASRLEKFTATDDQGTRYQMKVLPMAGGPDGWTLLLHPRPAHDPRWLDLTTSPGQPGVRLDLTPPSPAQQDATVTVTTAPASPGEHLLQAIAAKLLTTLLAASTGPDPAGPQPGPLGTAADGLGQVITALQAAGALSPFSPVPGQLAALYAVLPASSHGITAPPARDLPAPWLSVLADHHRRKPATARDGCAAVAVTLPELDGISLAILGLHNCQGRTIMHLHASGPKCPASSWPDELPAWPVTWIRDSGGSWHTTRTLGRGGTGEAPLRVELVPPLSRTATWIETTTTGQSGQIRARLPLRWQ